MQFRLIFFEHTLRLKLKSCEEVSDRLTEKGTQACSMHLMDAAVFSRLSAAVALSELALIYSPASQLFEKIKVSTQTDSNIDDLWLNSSVTEETISAESKV